TLTTLGTASGRISSVVCAPTCGPISGFESRLWSRLQNREYPLSGLPIFFRRPLKRIADCVCNLGFDYTSGTLRCCSENSSPRQSKDRPHCTHAESYDSN